MERLKVVQYSKVLQFFFNTMDVHVVSGDAVMLQHAATSLAGASIKR